MKLRGVRRCFALSLVVALTFGLAAQGFAAGTMGAMFSSATGTGYAIEFSLACDGCGSDDSTMSTAACYAVCGIAAAILPDIAPAKPLAAAQPTAVPARVARGRNGPPDPYPPKRSI